MFNKTYSFSRYAFVEFNTNQNVLKNSEKVCNKFKTYPLLHLQKSKATVRYDTAFSFKYLAYLLMNVDISYAKIKEKH